VLSVEVEEWTAASDWRGVCGLDGFEAMLRDREHRGWRLESVCHTLTGTRYGFVRPLA
jgi:hypothetical protein